MSRKSGANPMLLKKTKKVSKSKPTHPSTSEMVITAIKVLNVRGGTSLSAIKKFIMENYEVKMEILAPLIRNFLRNAIKNGILIRTRGKGLVGSFKLSKSLRRHVKKPQKNRQKTDEAGTSQPQRAVKKEKGKLHSVAGVVVRNEPVKEEILRQEPDLMDDESDEDDDEESLEEDTLVKEEDSMDEDEEVTVKKKL